jgi:hypothetical protein
MSTIAEISSAPDRGHAITIRPVLRSDRDGWRPLRDGYNAFYGRSGLTGLPEPVTQATWERFFIPSEPVNALVAEESGPLVIALSTPRRSLAAVRSSTIENYRNPATTHHAGVPV